MNFTKRKSVHVALMKETHSEFRALLLKHGISMQAVFEEFAKQAILENAYAVRVIESAKENKKSNQIKKLTKNETTDIFKILEEESPFND